MHGIKRILVFCTLTTVLPIILLVTPLYLRHNFYANVAYAVTDSDILEISDGISSIFCSAHTLKMNRTFNAFQMTQKPETTSYRKHIRLKKNMTLPDDTMEYWGFYLLKGATVVLSVCSRFQGASILVVKGERNLRTCGMLEHHSAQAIEGIFLPEAKKQVKVMFQSNIEEVRSNNSTMEITQNESSNEMQDKLWKISTKNTDDKIFSYYSQANGNLMSNKENPSVEEKQQIRSQKIQQGIASPQEEVMYDGRKVRHARKRKYKEQRNIIVQEKMKKNGSFVQTGFEEEQQDNHSVLLKRLQNKINDEESIVENIRNEMITEDKLLKERFRRNQDPVKPTFLLDQGVKHGGNAIKNSTDMGNNSSVSSFENELFKCYGGSILIAQEFAPSEKCTDVTYLLNAKHMQAIHNVVEDGYYYYIFYSDNDIVSNDLYALFDIYKPVFRYENVSKSCINETKCSFSINLLSLDRVIVEIPTKESLENDADDFNLLLSICHPRMEVYIIFPIAVLFFILACAFM